MSGSADRPATITHDVAGSRFVASVAGGEATLEYLRDGDRVVFTHTGVPREAEGQGIGGALARAGLEWARGAKLRVVPACPFVKTYVARHREYQDLVGR